jgi:guanylate kinase
MIFVISGPSGCGKSTLVKHLLNDLESLAFSISHTTRSQRDSEKDGQDYYFISQEDFTRMIEERQFAEWAIVHGHYYGTAKRELEKKGAKKNLILDIDVQGAEQIRGKIKRAWGIFVLPPSFQELKQRLERRGDERKEVMEGRLEMAKKEIRAYPGFDFIIVNDRLEDALDELKSIIISSKCRLEMRQKEIVPILRSFFEEDGIT